MRTPKLYSSLITFLLLFSLSVTLGQSARLPKFLKQPVTKTAQTETSPVLKRQSQILGDGSAGYLTAWAEGNSEVNVGEEIELLINNVYQGVAPLYKGRIEIDFPSTVEYVGSDLAPYQSSAIVLPGKVIWTFERSTSNTWYNWNSRIFFRVSPSIGDTIGVVAFNVKLVAEVPDSADMYVDSLVEVEIIHPESQPIGATKGIKWLRTMDIPTYPGEVEFQWAGIYGVDTSSDGKYVFVSGTKETQLGSFKYLAKNTLDGLSVWERFDEKSQLYNYPSISHTKDGGVVELSDSMNSDIMRVGVLLTKYASNGDLQWKSFVPTGSFPVLFFNSITVLPDEDILITFAAKTAGGELSDNPPDTTQENVVVMKLSATGQTLWYKVYGGDKDDSPTMIKNLSNGDILITGITKSVNGDINGFAGDPESYNDFNAFVLKLKSNGQLLWSKTFGAANADYLLSVVETSKGYLFAGFSDPWASRSSDTLKNGVAMWLLELNSQGQTIFQRITPVYPGYESLEIIAGVLSIIPAGDGNYYIGGLSGDKYGLLQSKHGYTDIIIAKITPTGDIIWQKAIGGTREDFLYSMILDKKGDIVFGGATNSGNDDIYEYHDPENEGMLVGKLGITNTISGKVFNDKNSNKIQDAGEAFINEGRVLIIKGGDTIYVRIFNGHYLANTDTGTYTISYKGNNNYYVANPAQQTASFDSTDLEANIDIALVAIPGIKDLQVSLSPATPARPGFEADYTIITKNVGTGPINGYVLQLAKPITTQFVSASRNVSTNTTDSIKFSSKNLAVGTADTVKLTLKLATPPTLNNGDTLVFTAIAQPLATDTTPLNNQAILRQIVTGSYDPNDKSEAHAGVYTPTMKANNEPFQYLIRFQNTGTDTAFYVTVKDTLSDQVDLNSLETINTSHPYTFSLEGNIATWQFDMIKLVDSTTNEPGSHGYISFSIQPKEELQIGDTVGNNAAIYFDFNLPVITNVSELLMISDQSVICPGSSTQLQAGYTGVAYQWQVNTGNGFTNIANNTQYAGATTNALLLKNVSSSFYNYQYRCLVTLSGGKTIYSNTYKLTFANTWLGTVSNAWENAANWSCGSVPDANTDVIIKATAIRQPQVNTTTATCRSINANQGSHVWIKVGAKLDVKGK